MNWTTYNNAGAALSQSLTDMPVGTITGYAGATAPSGWLLCDGSAVSRTTYAELFGVVGTTYGAGDASTTFNVPDSSGFIILASSQAARLAAAALPQYVTSLPSSPVDGQTVVYAADATNGVMWTLRYRAASSSSYKWEFVGGPPVTALVSTSQSTTSGTYTDLTTAGPSITLALAGDYLVKVTVTITGNVDQWTAAYVTVADDNVSVGCDITSMGNLYDSGGTRRTGIQNNSAQQRLDGIGAGSVMKMRYASSNGSSSVSFANRSLSITPVRVG